MKASMLVIRLNDLIAEHGDLDVQFAQVDQAELEVEIKGVCTRMDSEENSNGFLICDEDTLDAFVE